MNQVVPGSEDRLVEIGEVRGQAVALGGGERLDGVPHGAQNGSALCGGRDEAQD